MGACFEGIGKLVAVLVYFLDHASLVFKLIDSVLKLLIQDFSVCNHYNAVKNTLIPIIMKA